MMRRRFSLPRMLPALAATASLGWTTAALAAQPSPDNSLEATASVDSSADSGGATTESSTDSGSSTSTTESSGAASSGAASSGAAARRSSGSGGARRFRLHADTEFFGFTHFDDEFGMSDPDINVVGFGFGRSNMADSGACSILAGAGAGCVLSVRPLWGIGFGYAFMDQRAVVGARFSFTVDGVFDDDDQDNDETNLVAGQFVPYFRYIFLPGNTVRPYAEIRFGLGGGAAITNTPIPMGQDVKTTVNIIYPTVGAGGGAHIFLMDALSIDAGLNFDYFAPHVRTVYDPDPADMSTDYEQLANVLNLAITAGFSVWIP